MQSVASELVGEEPLNAPGEGDEEFAFSPMEELLKRLEDDLTYCKTYDHLCAIREELGTKSKQSPLLKRMQIAGPEKRLISGPEYKELCKRWARCDRMRAKLEEKLKPDVLDSFTSDEEDPDPEQDGR
jgi:hypothetical protein